MSPNIQDLRESLKTLEMRVKATAGAPDHDEAIRERDVRKAELEQAERAVQGDNEVLRHARIYLDHGLAIIPIEPGTKRPINGYEWSRRSSTQEELATYFGGSAPKSLAIALGPRSHDLTDVDFDWPEAARVADEAMATWQAFGRSSSPRSHRIFTCPGAKNEKFLLPATMKGLDGLPDEHALCIAEIRADKSYTLFPGSVHPSGESVVFDHGAPTFEPPATCEPKRLRTCLGRSCFLAVVVRFFPPRGIRNDTMMALAGSLAYAGMSAEGIESTVQLVGQMVGDPGHGNRWSVQPAAAIEKIKRGEEVTGIPRLVELLGLPKECIDTFHDWLGMGGVADDVLDRKDWTKSARLFVEQRMPLLRHHNGEFLSYISGAYRAVEEDYLTAVARDFLSKSKVRSGDNLLSFKPSRTDIQELLAAIKDGRHLARDSFSPPCWLDDDHASMAAPQCVGFPNGILHLPNGNFIAATPMLFTRNALEFAYDPQAQCPLWLGTLDQYWPRKPNGDPADEILLLQEVFGYLVSSDTAQQKMFFVLGPPRSGKGVISRLLAQLVGHANCTSPSLSSLGGEFGRMPLIGKQLAIISETKLDARKDNAVAIAGYLLAISGEDSLSINRKNKPFWEGRLPVRFLWLGNRIPTFADDGTALGNRLVILAMTQSFLGYEDLTLEARLKDELAGILNWAVEGWRRLQDRGHFVQTESGNAAQAEFIRLASPTLAFVQEKCVIGDGNVQVGKDELYRSYKSWAEANGRLADNKNEFGASLVAACGGRVRSHRPEIKLPSGKVDRPWCWRGIQVADAAPF